MSDSIDLKGVLKKWEELEAKFPKSERIEAILVTHLLPGIYKILYEDKNYITMDTVSWLQLERQFDTPKTKAEEIERALYPVWAGIPVYEDEELVHKIMVDVARRMSEKYLADLRIRYGSINPFMGSKS